MSDEVNNFNNSRFSHLFIDYFFEESYIENILNSFTLLDSSEWKRTEDSEIQVNMRSKWTSEFSIPEEHVRYSNTLYYYTIEPRSDSKIIEKEPHPILWKKKEWADNRRNKVENFE
tara:strand:- start:236 stop:583 length:348 start_codon:yes stop_codon:yes gene_type:complete